MFIAGFPAGPWGTNCYVAATAPGTECAVIDPGKDAAEGVASVVREHRLKPVAVLATHGHLDHVGSLPLLFERGFSGPIFGTPATLAIAKLVLEDALGSEDDVSSAEAARVRVAAPATGAPA